MTGSMKILERLFLDIISNNTGKDTQSWIGSQRALVAEGKSGALNMAFAAVPRKTGKQLLSITTDQENALKPIAWEDSLTGWTIDRLTRVWLLLQLDPVSKTSYIRNIEQLFQTAEMNELAALYSALPFLAYPEAWKMRCAEGIRSNIGSVLESVMYNNPYPARYLDDAAWNQLVLKVFFTGKDTSRLIGLDNRANQGLANILSDYAHERWSAGRPVDPQLWRCTGKFLDHRLFGDIEKLSVSENETEREAAALACADSNYLPAKDLLAKNSELASRIRSGNLSWKTLVKEQ